MARELAQAIAAAVFDAIETAALRHKSISLSAVKDAVEGVLVREIADTSEKPSSMRKDLYDLETLRAFFSMPPMGPLTTSNMPSFGSHTHGALTINTAPFTHTITINPK